MLLYEVFLVGVGLSMDAFAAAVCRGLSMKKINYKHAFIIALMFGGFQALMPLIGWALGKTFEGYISTFSPWIAFLLLSYIGGKMLYDGIKGEGECADCGCGGLRLKQLFGMAIATSIDALAVGVSFAFLETEIWLPAALIGIVTFGFSFGGVKIGNIFGTRYKSKAELVGGIILILIGLKIVLEHTGVL